MYTTVYLCIDIRVHTVNQDYRATSSHVSIIPDGKQSEPNKTNGIQLFNLSYKQLSIGEDIPDWRDLISKVVPQYAVHWEAIGAELGLKHYHIANISRDNHSRAEDGCTAMLMKWLQLGASPTWGTLDDAINKVKKEKVQTTTATQYSADNRESTGTRLKLKC